MKHYRKHHINHQNRISLTAKIAISYSVMVFLVLSLTLGLLAREETKRLVHDVDTSISSLSYTLAQNQTLIEETFRHQLSPQTTVYLQDLERTMTYVDHIVIVSSDDLRLYHKDPTKIGFQFNGGDEGPALAGSPSYITEEKGSKEFQRRSFTSVYGEDGDCIGFVFVSSYISSINLLKRQELIQYGIIYITALLTSFLTALLIARNIRRSLLGYDPNQITRMYLQREEVLDTLEEGLIMANTDGVCEYSNLPAKELFAHAPMQQILAPYIRQTWETGKPTINYQYQLSDTLLYMTLIPIKEGSNIVSVLILLRDRTDMTHMAEELTGVNHIIAALRANTHEHKNKLHVILGLLQIQEYQMAIDYINSSITNDVKDYSFLLRSIENKTIAALILGKINRARELNITLNLLKGSHLDTETPYLSTSDLITIIGNLIENAFDALSNMEAHWTREVNLFVQSSKDGITIIVDDTGCGMSQKVIDQILSGGYTSKGEGHGIGLSLIRKIVENCHGNLTIESEEGEGSSFSVSILSQQGEDSFSVPK